MPRETATVEINASCETIFDVIHDYSCRLEWDSMLSEARLLDGATAAGVGVRSRCVGTWQGLFLPLETAYVQFKRGEVAAVTLTNRPPFFDHFAATIRHKALGNGRCQTTYIYYFRARPRFLAPLLEPIMNIMLHREVHNRLHALRRFIENPAKHMP